MSALAKEEVIDGKYRIVRFLGKGAWASVYEGVNIRLHRRVAIKVLGKETLQHPGVIEARTSRRRSRRTASSRRSAPSTTSFRR